jgi:hypothetical protein
VGATDVHCSSRAVVLRVWCCGCGIAICI